ncbi:MAG: protein kinase domain-containing protein [Calditrichia bacterium]
MFIANQLFLKLRFTASSILLFLSLTLPSLLKAQVPVQDKQTPVTWYVHDNSIIGSFSKKKIHVSSSGDAWLGGHVKPDGMREEKLQTPLFRFYENQWHRVTDFPAITDRTFEMSACGDNLALVMSTPPTYDSLQINRYDGKTWTVEFAKPGIFPQASAIVSKEEAWVVGNHGNILHYINGKWTLRPLPAKEDSLLKKNLMAIKMLNRGYGWTVGKDGILAKYTEDKWKIIAPPEGFETTNFTGVDLTPDGTAWIIGWGGIILSNKNGNWHNFESPVDKNLQAIHMTSNTDGWAVGTHGTILRFNGSEWVLQPSPNDDYYRTIFIDKKNQGWIVGDVSILRATTAKSHPFKQALLKEKSAIDSHKARNSAIFDIDGDGDNDILAISRKGITIFQNDGLGTFTNISEAAGLSEGANLHSVSSYSIGDIDHDRQPEIIFTRNVKNSNVILQNNGSGKFLFRDLTGSSTYDDTSYLIDVDLDGDMDLYHAYSVGTLEKHQANWLLLNNGFGAFTLSDDSSGSKGCERTALWGDLNGDMYPDLILPESYSALLCYLNDGKGNLIDYSKESGLLDTMKGQMSMALLVDLDLDADLDFISIGTQVYVWLNDGEAKFTKTETILPPLSNTPISHTKTLVSGDINHDGYLDFIFELESPKGAEYQFFLSDSKGTYQDISKAVGLQFIGGNSILLEDRDSDGDLDIYFFRERAGDNAYLENQQNDRNYLLIRPFGTRANRMGIGSEISIYDAGQLGNPTHLRGYRQHGLGGNPRMVNQITHSHFGLSAKKQYDVQIRFPGGRTVTKHNVTTGQTLDVHEFPPVIRHGYLFWRAGLLAFSRSNPIKESIKLLLFLAFFTLVCFYFKKREKSLSFLLKWPFWLLLIFTYLFLNSFYVLNTSLLLDTAILGFSFLAIIGLAYGDSYYSFWKDANYLGHYRLISRLGEGGMGIVHKAYNVNRRQTSALKVLHPSMLYSEKNRMRFLREAKIMEALQHQNIVRIFETGEIAGRGYINMELLEGVTLGEFVKQSEQLSTSILVPIVLQICDALEYIHSQEIIHRDIKSDNIFLITAQTNLSSRLTRSFRGSSGDSNLIKVKLMDFGLARSMQMMTLTKMEAIVGTLAYMSPEQAIGSVIDQRSDIYSLGVVMYEALTGKFPFSGEHEVAMLQSIIANKQLKPINELRQDILPELEQIIMRMLRYNPADRFQSAKDLQDALKAIPISLEAATSYKSSHLDNQTAGQLSQKSINFLKSGDFDQATTLSNIAIKKLDNGGKFEANSGQIYLNHSEILEATGQTQKAKDYLRKAHQSVVIKKISHSQNQSISLPPDPTDREIIIRYETERWTTLYQRAIELNEAKQYGDARNTILECAGILTQVFMLFDTEADKETYINEYRVAEALSFMKKFDL